MGEAMFLITGSYTNVLLIEAFRSKVVFTEKNDCVVNTVGQREHLAGESDGVCV